MGRGKIVFLSYLEVVQMVHRTFLKNEPTSRHQHRSMETLTVIIMPSLRINGDIDYHHHHAKPGPRRAQVCVGASELILQFLQDLEDLSPQKTEGHILPL